MWLFNLQNTVCQRFCGFFRWLNVSVVWFHKGVRLYVSLWENEPTSHLIYDLSKQISDEFMVSIYSVKSSLLQHNLPFRVKKTIKQGMLSGLATNQDTPIVFSEYGHFWFQNTKMVTP